jgi:monoamine oxidase
MPNEEKAYVAVVGGGISGLYIAWRILTGEPNDGHSPSGKRVVVLELSKRTGGRLLTWRPFTNQPDLHGELGGMRFFQQQTLVWSLVNVIS